MNFKKNILAFFVIGIAGVLGHFLYEWTGENMLVGMFFPVNESTWEHLKLLFFPSVIYFIAKYFLSKKNKDYENYFPAIAISVFCGMLTIVTLFYTISGILGYNVDFINIIIYFIGVIVTICKRNKVLREDKFSSKNANIISAFFLGLTAFLFAVWSFNPPSIGIFTPPVM